MRLLITGALGHIGSRLIHDLRPGDFDQVILVDNLAAQRHGSLFNLPAGVPFRFVEADICHADLRALVDGIDVVIHLAAASDSVSSFEKRAEIEATNVAGTRRVAEACAAAGARLLFPSTASVYGTRNDVVDELCLASDINPQSPYAESKLRAERVLQELRASSGLRFVTCRFGTVYGVSPGIRWHTAVSRFVWCASLGRPLTVWRTAMHQRRPYLDVVDAVRAMRFLIDRDAFDGQIYNVLTENLTVHDVVDALSSVVADVSIELVDSKVMNDLSYSVSSERLRALGFAFIGDHRRAVKEMVDLLRNARQASAQAAAGRTLS
jgi:UDP-glucose 4-epimerase